MVQARASEEGVVAMRGPGGQMMLSAEGPRATAEAGHFRGCRWIWPQFHWD